MLSNSLKAATAAVDKIMADRVQMEQAIEHSTADRLQAETRLAEALAALGQIEADLALSNGTEDPPSLKVATSARKEVRQIREELEGIDARIGALRSRHAASEDTFLAAAGAFDKERDVLAHQHLDEYRKRYKAAAAEFAEVIYQGLTLASSLGEKMPGLRDMIILDCDFDSDVMALHEFTRPPVTPSKSVEKILAELSPPMKTAQKIKPLEDIILKRRAQEKAKETQRLADERYREKHYGDGKQWSEVRTEKVWIGPPGE